MNSAPFPNPQVERVFHILQFAWGDDITPQTAIHDLSSGPARTSPVDAIDLIEIKTLAEECLRQEGSDRLVVIKVTDASVGDFAVTLAAHLYTDEKIAAFENLVRSRPEAPPQEQAAPTLSCPLPEATKFGVNEPSPSQRTFLAILAEHVALIAFGVFCFILFQTLMGGFLALFGWLPVFAKLSGSGEWPQWGIYTMLVLVGLGTLIGMIQVPIDFVKWLQIKLAAKNQWLRMSAYALGAIGGTVGGAAFFAAATVIAISCVLTIGFLVLKLPLSGGLEYGSRFYGLTGETFGEGCAVGFCGALVVLLLLGIPFGICVMIGDFWRWLRELMQLDATGRAVVRALYGFVYGALIGLLAGWLVYQYAWSNGWADRASGYLWTGTIAGAFLSAVAQMPRDAPEQYFLALAGAALGGLVFVVAHGFSAGGPFSSFLGRFFIGGIVGAVVAWGCWVVFGLTGGWMVAPGPTFREVFPEQWRWRLGGLALRPWLLIPAFFLLVFLGWTDLPYRGERIIAAPSDTVRPALTHIALSPDGSRAICGNAEGKVWVVDLEAKEEIPATLDVGRVRQHEGTVRSVGFSLDGKNVLSAGSDKVHVWNAETGKSVLSFDAQAAAWADGNTIISMNGGVWEWRNVGTGNITRTAVGRADWSPVLAVTPDGKHAATAQRDHSIRLWDLAAVKELRALEGHKAPIRRLALASDGVRVLSVDEQGAALLWSIENATPIKLTAGSLIHDAAFSPDGKRFATAAGMKDSMGPWGGSVRLWDTATVRELRRYAVEGQIPMAVALTSDGGWSIYGGDKQAITLIKLPR